MHRFALAIAGLLLGCSSNPTTPSNPLPPPPGPVPSPVVDTTGFRPLIIDHFTRQDDPGLGPVLLSPTWVGTMYADSGAALAPFTHAVRWDYPAGNWGGVSPGHVWAVESTLWNENVHELYLKASYRWSVDFVGHINTAKVFLLGFGAAPTGGNQFILGTRGAPASAVQPFSLNVGWQGLGSLPTSSVGNVCCADTTGGNYSGVGPVNMTRTVWHTIEVRISAGVHGQQDASVRVWQDGVLIASQYNFDISRTVDSRVTEVKLAPVWGGGASPIPVVQSLWLADLYVSGQ